MKVYSVGVILKTLYLSLSLGVNILQKKYHKKSKESLECKSEEFELE